MSDPQNVPPRDTSPEGPSHNRKVPPLVWIVLAIVLGVLAYSAVSGGLGMRNSDAAKATAEAPT
jgi:hypothetical protein